MAAYLLRGCCSAPTYLSRKQVILTTRDAESWYQSCEETIFVASDGPPNPRRTLGIRVFMAVIPFFRRFNRMLSKILWEQFFQGRYDKQSIIRYVTNVRRC